MIDNEYKKSVRFDLLSKSVTICVQLYVQASEPKNLRLYLRYRLRYQIFHYQTIRFIISSFHFIIRRFVYKLNVTVVVTNGFQLIFLCEQSVLEG